MFCGDLSRAEMQRCGVRGDDQVNDTKDPFQEG